MTETTDTNGKAVFPNLEVLSTATGTPTTLQASPEALGYKLVEPLHQVLIRSMQHHFYGMRSSILQLFCSQRFNCKLPFTGGEGLVGLIVVATVTGFFGLLLKRRKDEKADEAQISTNGRER